MERSTIFHGKTHDFYGDFPYVKVYQRVSLDIGAVELRWFFSEVFEMMLLTWKMTAEFKKD
jgi:hypothetical protein